jgi:molecular chaperone GrpE (heat shock protein)
LTNGAETPGIEIPQAVEIPENELLQRLKSIGEANGELLQQLVKDFTTKLKYDATKQEQIDKLYKENVDFNGVILDEFKRLVILAVIGQIDDAEKSIKSFGDKECSEDNYQKLLNTFRSIVSEWQEMLLQQFDVSSYQCEPNSPVDVKRQRILKQIPTDDATLYKHVQQTLRPGYELDGQVLRPELVEVFVKR